MNLFEYPLQTGSWVCSECGKKGLKQAYPCEVCYAVLCPVCVKLQHEQPMTGLMCGEQSLYLEQVGEEDVR